MRRAFPLAALLAFGAVGASSSTAAADARVREVWYDPAAVLQVPVRRGVVTHIVLDAGERITEVAAGVGADCAKAEASWCVAAEAGGHHVFVKPRSTAEGSNNLAVVTDRRAYAIELVPLADEDRRPAVYRLTIRSIAPAAPARITALAPSIAASAPQARAEAFAPASRPSGKGEADRTAPPRVVNSRYSVAEAPRSSDIVPTLVFDDGRFTYFRLPGNVDLPAVFHVGPDGAESVVNTRMEGDLLVADRVSRQLVLRAGDSAVGVWNEAFDTEGRPPVDGTAVPSLVREDRR